MKSQLRRRISPSVPFTLTFEDELGKTSQAFRLAYNLNSLTLVEEKLGKSMLTDIGEVIDVPSVKNISVLLWAALQENHADEFEGDEGLELTRQNLTLAQSKEALNACSEAYVKQLPAEQQERIMAIVKAKETGSVVPPFSQRKEVTAQAPVSA